MAATLLTKGTLVMDAPWTKSEGETRREEKQNGKEERKNKNKGKDKQRKRKEAEPW
jgi:hypothetical protein